MEGVSEVGGGADGRSATEAAVTIGLGGHGCSRSRVLEGFRVVGLGFGTGGLGLEMVGEFLAIIVVATVILAPPIFPIRR